MSKRYKIVEDFIVFFSRNQREISNRRFFDSDSFQNLRIRMLYFDETKVTDLEAVLFAENDLRIAVCPALEIV